MILWLVAFNSEGLHSLGDQSCHFISFIIIHSKLSESGFRILWRQVLSQENMELLYTNIFISYIVSKCMNLMQSYEMSNRLSGRIFLLVVIIA